MDYDRRLTAASFPRDEKLAIMREKHSALMRPVVFALEHVCSITAAPAETPHETWFQQTYRDAIGNALERLQSPNNPANPASSWAPFKQVDDTDPQIRNTIPLHWKETRASTQSSWTH